MSTWRQAGPDRWGRGAAAGVLALLTVAHVAVALLAFSPLSSFISAASIDSFDYCALDYQCHLARETFAASGRLWGYDPFFLAGHVQTFVWNSNVFLQLLTVLLSFLPVGMVLKLATVLAAAAVPALAYVGWRGFGFHRDASLIGALVGVAWFRLTVAHAFWAIGMTTGFLVFPLSFACLGLLAALWRDQRRSLALLALIPLALLVHKTAVVTIGLPALVLMIFARSSVRPRHVALLAGAAVLALVVNAFWIAPALAYREYAAFDPLISYWTNPDPWAFFRDLIDPSARIGTFNRQNWLGDLLFRDLAFTGALFAMWRYRARRHQWLGPAAAVGAMGLFTYVGSLAPALQPVDPSRFVPYVFLLLAMAATVPLVLTRRRGLAAAALLVGIVTLGWLPSSAKHFVQQPVLAQPSATLDVMADWINALSGNGRVHVETFSSFFPEKPPGNEQYGRISIKLPTRTHRPLLGGHYSGVFTAYNHANFFSGVWRQKPLGRWTADELAEALRLYHVEYLLTWSKPAAEALAKLPDVVERIPAPEGYAGWRVKDPGDYFLRGSGKLEAWAYDQLELIDVEPDDGLAVLSFHYAPTLFCEGAKKLVPVLQPGDPVPFIGLLEPGSHVVIRNGGTW